MIPIGKHREDGAVVFCCINGFLLLLLAVATADACTTQSCYVLLGRARCWLSCSSTYVVLRRLRFLAFSNCAQMPFPTFPMLSDCSSLVGDWNPMLCNDSFLLTRYGTYKHP